MLAFFLGDEFTVPPQSCVIIRDPAFLYTGGILWEACLASIWYGALECRSSFSFDIYLNILKEARRAAQRGMDVERVDDRVKKAVALANQAANAARVAAVKAVHR